MKQFKSDIQILLVPLGVLFVVLVLILISVKTIFDKAGSLNQILADNQKTENMLKTKLTSLQTVNPEIANQSEVSLLALPGTNSVLDAVSQVQTQASNLDLTLTNLNSESITQTQKDPTTVAINSTDISFNVDGSFLNIANFINKIKNSTPITIFNTIKISNQNSASNDSYRLATSLTSYWAPLPKTIPAITEPIATLTADEKQILSDVSSLQKPVSQITVATGSASIGGVGKTNPFQ